MINVSEIFNVDLSALASLNKTKYSQNEPFPHIIFQDILDNDFLEKVLDEFPDLEASNQLSYKNTNEFKFASKGGDNFGVYTNAMLNFLNSSSFLQFLQQLTGIDEQLYGDPYFYGGGLHEIKNKGYLKIHADFNKHPINKLDRRLNVLIYLNKNREDEYGGNLELWDKKMEACKVNIPPIFNTMVIFSTTDFANHGHPDPLKLPDNCSRKSLALYYYSHGRPANETNNDFNERSTSFKKRKTAIADKKMDSVAPNIVIKKVISNVTPPILLDWLKFIKNKL